VEGAPVLGDRQAAADPHPVAGPPCLVLEDEPILREAAIPFSAVQGALLQPPAELGPAAARTE
jgi:hypothetical protein